MLRKKRGHCWSDVLEQMKGNAVRCNTGTQAHGQLTSQQVGGSVLGGRESEDRERVLRVWESGREKQSWRSWSVMKRKVEPNWQAALRLSKQSRS